MADPKPRTWTLVMYCYECGVTQRVTYTAPKQDGTLARATLRANGWIQPEKGPFIHTTCPKKPAA